MADLHDKSENSLHTIDIEALSGPVVDPLSGDSLCVACWAMFDGAALPTCPFCGELAPAEGWAELPHRFLDRYLFLELLGRGGVGAVFRARHVDPSRGEQEFAVKVVQQGARPERRKMLSTVFEREISAAALVGRSRHFVRVLGHDTGDHLHLAMEYVPWPTLKTRLREGTLAPDDVAKLGVSLLRALEVMHAHNLVHRDLKPANIFVNEEDGEVRVKVADLGLWILSEDRRGDVTESLPAGTFAGTLDYASPEQMDGVEVGLRSDLHAVGSILWAAATGDVPFPAMGASFLSSLKARRELVEKVPPIPEGMPQALYDVIKTALQPRADDRFASAQEFAAALEQFGTAPESDPAPMRETLPMPRGRMPEAEEKAPARISIPRKPLAGVLAGVSVLAIGYVALSLRGSPSGGTTEASPSPQPVAASSSAAGTGDAGRSASGPPLAALAIGDRHTCAVLEGGRLACWGANERGQLGDGTTTGRSRPVRVAGVSNVAEVGMGRSHTCARTAQGEVWCWGSNAEGELGDGTTTARAAPAKVVVPAVDRLFVRGCRVWASTKQGEAWGWGCLDAEPGSAPRRIEQLDGIRSIHTWEQDAEGGACALFEGRPPRCWSWGTTEDLHQTAVVGLERVRELALAKGHGCARLEDGGLRCWGRNDAGEVGDGTKERRALPVEVVGVGEVEQVVVGPSYGCARTKRGEALCWGRGERGQTGAGLEDKLVPVVVPTLAGVADLATDQGKTCALTREGRVACWGPGFTRPEASWVWVVGLQGATSIACGRGVFCSVLATGGAACFGDDEFGQLGVGRPLQRTAPAPVEGVRGATKLWAASRNAAALDEHHQLLGWGQSTWGAFETNDGFVSRPVVMGTGVHDVGMGTRGLYARARDEEGVWGVRAGGTLLQDHGIGASARYAYPQTVPGLDEAEQFGVGARHSCAKMVDGTVRCWGDNSYGQLGDGSASAQKVPTAALVSGEVELVASGAYHACALRKSGGVMCWGSNRNGQTGPGPTWTCRTGKNVYPCVRRPRRVIGVQDAVALGAGQWHACALSKSGAIACWGANGFAQLGDGTTRESPAPRPVRHITNAVSLGVGEKHACAVLRDGGVWCWGENGHDELGRASADRCGPFNEPCSTTPGPVQGLTEAVQVAIGLGFSCALRRDGTVWCWGNNQRGTLGDGIPVYRTDAVAVLW